MSITLEGYNVSFDRLKIEKEYKHPIIYDKFPIKANNSTMIHVSEPKIPFRFPDYGCLWNGKKENPYFNANPFKNLKDIEKYYLPPNSVNNMIKPPMFTGSTKIFLNNNIESIHEQWKLFSHNTGLKKTKEVVEKFGVSSGTTDQKEIDALPEMMPTGGSIGSGSGFGTPEEGSRRSSISSIKSVRREALRELTEEETKTARLFEGFKQVDDPELAAKFEALRKVPETEVRAPIPAIMDVLNPAKDFEGDIDFKKKYPLHNPENLANLESKDLKEVEQEIKRIVSFKTKNEQDKELDQYIKKGKAQLSLSVKNNLIKHNVKRYQDNLMNKTDESMSINNEAFSKYRAGRIEEITKMMAQLQKDQPKNVIAAISDLANEIKTIELDSLLLQTRVANSIEINYNELYASVQKTEAYKAKTHALHGILELSNDKFTDLVKLLKKNEVNMIVKADGKIKFENDKGVKVTHDTVRQIMEGKRDA